MKMLLFDFRESEKKFFKNNSFGDFDIEFIREPLDSSVELTEEQYKNTDIISVFVTSFLTEEVLKKFKNLRIIALRSTGYNHVDLKYCKAHRIAVFNVENYGKSSVAQFTIMLIIALVRNLKSAYLHIKENKVSNEIYEGRNLEALTLGIIGCGSIGGEVAKAANLFGMKILVNSLNKNKEVSEFCQNVSIEELLKNSDIITLHLPYNKEIYHLIGRKEFEIMKNGVYIINTARGELIDSVALYENINSGKVKGAALDVFECETLAVKPEDAASNIDEYDSECVANALVAQKLILKENVIMTPHIAYNTTESVEKILEITFNNIKDYCKGLHTNQVV